MKGFSIKLAIVLLATVCSFEATAEPTGNPKKPRLPLGTNPNPVIWGGNQTRTAPKPPAQEPARHSRPHSGCHRSYDYYNYAPCLGGACGYWPYSACRYYPYQYVFTSVYPYVYADDVFGPQAAQRFMGPDAADAPAARGPNPQRATNAQATALAWRFIGFGDVRFARQDYLEANDRYRKAARSAPQLADAWFRQALTLAAMGRNRQAVAAVSRGLEINPDWPQGDFELQTLFNGDAAAKQALLDALADAAEQNPLDAERLFMLGVFLHCDGQPAEAEKHLRRSLQLTGGDTEHIRAFLAK